MELFILRHAIAAPLSESTDQTDRGRALTPEGEKKMERIAKAMQALDLDFDRVWHSPFLRARQTAEVVRRVLGLKCPVEDCPALEPGQPTAAVIAALTALPADDQQILLVGHEPNLSRLAALLIAGNAAVPITLKKGGLIKLTIERLKNGRCASLDWLLAPKHLTRIE